MAGHNQEQNAGAFLAGPRPPRLNDLECIQSELNRRIQQEVDDLERRISALQFTSSPGRETIIATYMRVIENKRAFLSDLDC